MARLVVICRMPLAIDSFSCAKASGSRPYLAGLKKALCVAIRNSTPISSGRLPEAKAPMARLIAISSGALVRGRTRLLR